MSDDVANLLLKITSDEDDAERGLKSLGDQLKLFGEEEATAKADVNTESGQVSLRDLAKALSDFSKETATAHVDVDAGAARINIAEVSREVSALDGKDATINFNTKGIGDVSALSGVFSSLLKQATLITVLGFAAQAVGLLGGAIAALGAAVGPAVGALASMPVVMSAIAQGALVAKLGLTGFGDSMKGFGKAFSEQTPAAADFAKQLKEFIPDLVHLRNLAQGPILRGLSDGIRDASGNLGVLNPIVRGTGIALGDLARQAGELVGSAGFGRDLATLGARNVNIIKILGGAVLDLVKAFTDVAIAAGPLTMWLVRTAAGWASNAAASANAARQSGSMAAFFEKTRTVLEHLFSILGSLAGILGAVGRAGFDLGSDLLAGADKGAAGLDKLANSAKGQGALKQFFDDLRPSLKEAGLLIKDVAVAFADLATQPGLTALIKTIRTDLLPVLVAVVASTTQAFGPVLVQATANFVRFLQPLLGASGPLTQFVRLLGGVAGVLADIMGATPGANAAFASIIGGAATFKAALLLGKFTGITSLVTALRAVKTAEEGSTLAALKNRAAIALSAAAATAKAAALAVVSAVTATYAAVTNGSALASIRQRLATIAVTAVLAAQTAATGLATAATIALDAAMAVLTSPIFLVVAAVAALIAIGYLLIKNWDTVQSVLGSVWDFLKGAASAAFDLIKSAAENGLLGPVGLIISRWGQVKDFLSGVWSFLEGAANSVWNAIKSVVTTTVNTAISVITGAWNAASSALAAVWSAISSAATAVWNAIKSSITSVVHSTVSAIGSIFSGLGGVLSGVWSGISSSASAAWNSVKSTISGAADAARDAVVSIFSGLRGTLSGVWDGVEAGARAGWNGVKGAISGAVNGALNAVEGAVGSFKHAGASLVNAIKDGIVSAAESVYDAVRSVIKKATDLLPGSEPKDPTSPMRGLPERGKAIMENLARGIPQGGIALSQALTAQLNNLPVMKLAPSPAPVGGPSYSNTRIFNLPPGPDGRVEPTFAAAQIDNLLRDEGGLR